MGHARNRGSRGWVTARGHPAGSINAIVFQNVVVKNDQNFRELFHFPLELPR